MDLERVVPGWQAASRAVEQGVMVWRQAHPRATLAELEEVVAEAVSRLQARYLEDLAHASAARDLTATTLEERPRCPRCGEALQARGRQERRVLTP
ncbi:MAG: ISKra4 family transposase, partial [Solirubrobacterales bacterium]